jgi:hypothetical protein
MSTNIVFEELDLDTWFDTYKPIKNHLDENSSFDGHMFETYGDEVEFVKAQDENRIWMYGDGDDGGGYIWNGWHFINRLGYFITEVPCPPDTTIQIQVSVPWYFCEGCNEEMQDPDNIIRDAFDEHDLEKCPKCVRLDEITPAILKAMEHK